MDITIFEVGPRDGLQNEHTTVSLDTRLGMIRRLVKSGVRQIEVCSFVSPKWIPQMSGSSLIAQKISSLSRRGLISKDVQFFGLVPNVHGFQDAVSSGLNSIAIFTAASQTFSLKNTNCTIEQSFQRLEEVIKLAKKQKIKVRGYISTAFFCPYEGIIPPKKVIPLIERLIQMGCYEVSIGDTIGAATPGQVKKLLIPLIKSVGFRKLAMHFHDTRGTALANILQSMKLEIKVFDTSLGGLGGCPYAPGAMGNVATEDVVYMMQGMGLNTGIDLSELILTSRWMSRQIGRQLPSRVALAGLPEKKR